MFYPILLVFCPAFFVAIKRTYPDMLASSRLECGIKILRHFGQNIFPVTLMDLNVEVEIIGQEFVKRVGEV